MNAGAHCRDHGFNRGARSSSIGIFPIAGGQFGPLTRDPPMNPEPGNQNEPLMTKGPERPFPLAQNCPSFPGIELA